MSKFELGVKVRVKKHESHYLKGGVIGLVVTDPEFKDLVPADVATFVQAELNDESLEAMGQPQGFREIQLVANEFLEIVE